jgi:hypothetical protein
LSARLSSVAIQPIAQHWCCAYLVAAPAA